MNEIPVVRLTQVLGDKMCKVKLHVMRYEDDAVHDALALLSILVAEHPTQVLEIGTYMGTPLGLWQKILSMQPFTRLIYLRVF